MLTLGVTGGSGSGKSTLLAVWASLGCVPIEADKLYHVLLAEDTALLAQIQKAFPQAFSDGILDRKRLGSLVFSDKQALARLEGITHGLILDAIREHIDQARIGGAPAVAIDAIRLLESPLAALCDAVVAVIAPFDQRLRRIMTRDGLCEDYALARIAAQPDDAFYRSGAHISLENHGDPTQFMQACADLYAQLLYQHTR